MEEVKPMFAHEKLEVYGKALRCVCTVSGFVARWDKKHAVTDQLDRASESLVLNLAEAARERCSPSKLRALDYSIGSCLECAACLDIARIKNLLTCADAEQEKLHLAEVMRMLVGLRKAWANWTVKEDSPAFGVDPPELSPVFHHERLEVYRASLQLMEWYVRLPGAEEWPKRLQHRLDESPSVALNIAEDNGRYSELDHRRFLDLAASAAVKTAAYLDVAAQKGVLLNQECSPAKALLERVIAMLSRM